MKSEKNESKIILYVAHMLHTNTHVETIHTNVIQKGHNQKQYYYT